MSSATLNDTRERQDSEHRRQLETLYAEKTDPWDYERSDYELTKYAETLAALPRERYRSGLEIGSSIGVFTEQAAPRIDRLLGIDLAETAIARSRERCARLPGVSFRCLDFIGEDLTERFDVIFCAEVLYYVQPWRRMAVARKIAGWLEPGGDLVLVRARRKETRTWAGMYGEGGAERLHRLFSHALGLPVVARHRTEQYEIVVMRAGPSAYPAWRRWAEAAGLTLLATGPQAKASLYLWLRRYPRLRPVLRAVKRLGLGARRSLRFGAAGQVGANG